MNLEKKLHEEAVQVPTKRMVAGLVIQNGKVLMVHNIKHGLRIEPPGGKVKDGESLEHAVRRECMEELGLAVEPKSLVGTYKTHSPEGPFEVSMFVCFVQEGIPEQNKEPEKIGHFEWFSSDELRALCARSQQTGSHLLVPNMQAAVHDVIRCIESSGEHPAV